MLVCTRKVDGSDKSKVMVQTSDGWITFEVLAVRSGNTVSVGISAPMRCEIYRGEILPKTVDEPQELAAAACA